MLMSEKIVKLKLNSIALLAVMVSLFACSAAPAGEGVVLTETETPESSSTSEPLTSCAGSSCDGLNPQTTNCVLDQEDTGVGAAIFDTTGRQIGGIGLFRSRSCQTVWAASAFYVAYGPRNYRICTVRVRATGNEPSCFDYYGSLGNVGPMKYAPSGKTVFGRIHLLDNPTVKAVTPSYTVP